MQKKLFFFLFISSFPIIAMKSVEQKKKGISLGTAFKQGKFTCLYPYYGQPDVQKLALIKRKITLLNDFNVIPFDCSADEFKQPVQTSLDLSFNQITKIPEDLVLIEELKELDLNHNQLKTFPWNVLKKRKNPLTLYLSHNPLAIPNVFKIQTALTKVHFLEISSDQLSCEQQKKFLQQKTTLFVVNVRRRFLS